MNAEVSARFILVLGAVITKREARVASFRGRPLPGQRISPCAHGTPRRGGRASGLGSLSWNARCRPGLVSRVPMVPSPYSPAAAAWTGFARLWHRRLGVGDGGVEDENTASPPEQCEADGGVKDENTTSPPEQCEALASAIAGVLGGALREHEEQVAATVQSQDGVVAAINRLNGELDKLLENAPSLVIMQHSVRISSIRKRISALNMLLKSIQQRIDNIDRIISTDHTSPVQKP
ncbi:hypothetical protein BS78_07G032200 [Paspalum vaginatum]|nr:hypothetical protein BS78_07G032200 [Paspalum vaginatum]KAJ1267121.1 hypothetical protein BS78_07G032200 [Paspalum vaginatum]KAJ1267122.1 hypothetical protein BS78_07G032200 [Paspalum vaginatum]